MMIKTDEIVTWAGVSNWVPLIVMAVSFAIYFATMQKDLALLKQSQEQMRASQEEMKLSQREIISLLKDRDVAQAATTRNLESRYGQLSVDVSRLKAIVGD